MQGGTVGRLFAGVVVLALLLVFSLSLHLLGWRTEIVSPEASSLQTLHRRPLELSRHVLLHSEEISSSGRSSGATNSSLSSHSGSEEPVISHSEPVAGVSQSAVSQLVSHSLSYNLTSSDSLSTHLPSLPHNSRMPSSAKNNSPMPTTDGAGGNVSRLPSSDGNVSPQHPTHLTPSISQLAGMHRTSPVSPSHSSPNSLVPPSHRSQTSPVSPSHSSPNSLVPPSHRSQTSPVPPSHSSQTSLVPPSHRSQTSPQPVRQGFVLAENYYEQQTMGLRNMMQLQCWAQSLKLLVVQPVTHDSFLRTPLDSSQQANFLKFGASFDEAEWNQQAERLGYAPLVPWDQFLSMAPREVVVVKFEHPSVSTVKSRQRAGQGILHSPDAHRYTTGCSGKWPSTRDLQFLKSNRFQIVRTVCFNFYYGDQLTLETFNQHILGDLSPSSVTIVFETWRGISSAQRVLLKDACQNTALVQEHISLSPQLTQQAEQYTHKYLGGSRRYLAVMGRLEITQLTVHKKVPVVPFCLEETLSEWRHFKTDSKLDKTFLSIDIGRYGSKKYRSGLQPELEMAFNKFFQTLFGQKESVREWERKFELVAGTRDAGYIGLLQKVLVTRAECVLFVGGGAFQRHALFLYKQLHPDPRDQCYRIVKPCTRSNKLS